MASTSSVWYACIVRAPSAASKAASKAEEKVSTPILTNSFSTMFLPFRRSMGADASKSRDSTSIVREMRKRSLETVPVELSEETLRKVSQRSVSPTLTRLYTVHRSSASSGTNLTRPPIYARNNNHSSFGSHRPTETLHTSYTCTFARDFL